MSLKDKKILLIRLLTVTAGFFLLAVTFTTFIKQTRSTFDENYYQPMDSKFYIAENFEAQPLILPNSNVSNPVNVSAGNVLLKINDVLLEDSLALEKALQAATDENKSVDISVLDLKSQKVNDYSILKKDLLKVRLAFVPNAAMVFDVIKGGASDRAGMRIGDIIIGVNGRHIRNAFQADSLVMTQRSGKTINYTILRDNKVFDIFVVLSSFGISFFYLSSLISGLFYLAFGMYLVVRRPWLKAALLTGLAFICFGFLLANPRTISSDSFYLMHYNFFFVRAITLLLAIFLGLPLIIHSSLYFPKERSQLLKKSWVIYVPYIMGSLFILLNLIFTILRINIRIPFGMQMMVFTFIIYRIIIGVIDRKNYSREQKELRKPIRWAIIILVPLYIAFQILNFSQSFTAGSHLTIYGAVLNLLFLIVPFVYIYIIARHHLLDLELRIKKNSIYIAASVLWNIVAVGVVLIVLYFLSSVSFKLPNLHLTGASIEVLDKPLNPEHLYFYNKFLLALFSVFVVLIAWKIKRKVQDNLDRKFHRIRFDYRRAATDFSDILASNLTISDLASSIVHELGELVQLKRVGILIFKNEEKVSEQNYFGFNSESLREFCFATGAKLIDAIKQFYGEFRVDYLPEPVKGVFKQFGFRYVVPIRSKGKIIAALIIGEKLSESSFRRDDLAFLTSIASQTCVALENAMLYEDLAVQERIKHELDIARRIQLASLPQSLPNIEGLDISGISIPALEVGGDFYDFLDGYSDELTVVIGDVSGKGTSAALYMSKVQGILRTLHEFDLSPRKLFIRTNELLYKYLEKSSFISAIGAKLIMPQQKIHLSRAGHLPLFYYNSRTNSIDRIIPKGLVLGLSKDSLFERNLEEVEIKFNSGDIFLFVTDGVLDARNSSHVEYGEERLLTTFKRSLDLNAEEIKNSIINNVQSYAGEVQQFDDITVVVIKIK